MLTARRDSYNKTN